MEVITVFRLLGRSLSLAFKNRLLHTHYVWPRSGESNKPATMGELDATFGETFRSYPTVTSDLKSICRCSIYRYIDRIDVSALRLVLTLVWPCTVCSGSPSFRLALFAFIFLELKMLKIERHIFIICILVAIAWKSRYWLVYSQASCLPFWRIVIGRSRLSG